MRAQICFFVSIVFSFVARGAVTGSLILPELRRRGRNEALRPLLMFHFFRFVGLAFLVSGVVSPDLPAAFAEGAAYGDIVAAALALLTLALLPGRLGIVAAWVFNLWGSADILHANYEGIHLGIQAGQLGAAYFLPTFIVPLFLITHGLMFWLLGAESCSATMLTMRDVCARLELSPFNQNRGILRRPVDWPVWPEHQEIGGPSCRTTTRLSSAPDSLARPWRGDWWLQAGRSRSSNASCSAAHA